MGLTPPKSGSVLFHGDELRGRPPHYNARKQLETVVIITISRNGTILDTQFEKKSGDANLDRSVLRAIKKAGPLPPLPAGLGGKQLELGIRFIPGEERP